MYFSEILKQERINAGYLSAKDFHKKILSEGLLSISYSHYTKIEKGLLLPSVEDLLNIIAYLQVKNFSRLVFTYLKGCATTKKTKDYLNNKMRTPIKKQSEGGKVQQVLLSEVQAGLLTKSIDHYLIFLKIGLSTGSISIEELKTNTSLTSGMIYSMLEDFVKHKILKKVNNRYEPVSRNMKISDKYKAIAGQLGQLLVNKNNHPLYQRAIYLKSDEDLISNFIPHLKKLEDSYLSFQHNNPNDNKDVFLLNVRLFKRDDLKVE